MTSSLASLWVIKVVNSIVIILRVVEYNHAIFFDDNLDVGGHAPRLITLEKGQVLVFM